MKQYQWQEFYWGAVLETDWTKMEERVEAAESEIAKRQRVLSNNHGGTVAERYALADALRGLAVLRIDAVAWLERQNQAPQKSANPPDSNLEYKAARVPNVA